MIVTSVVLRSTGRVVRNRLIPERECRWLFSPRGSRVLSSREFLPRNAMTDKQSQLSSMVPSFMTWIDRCNNGLHCVSDTSMYTPFQVDGQIVGYVDTNFVTNHLSRFPEVFRCSNDLLELDPDLWNLSLHDKSDIVAGPLRKLHDEGIITGWRNELYPVLTSFDSDPVLLMERAASVYFGIKAYGVHVNGYVEREDGGMDMWVARRSATKPTWPGKLDHIVAGGQPHGLSTVDNVIKECEEEAGISLEVASQAKAVGAVSYCSKYSYGLKRDVLFCLYVYQIFIYST